MEIGSGFTTQRTGRMTKKISTREISIVIVTKITIVSDRPDSWSLSDAMADSPLINNSATKDHK